MPGTAAVPGRKGHVAAWLTTEVVGLDTFTGTSGTPLISHNANVGFGSPGWGPLDNSFFQIAAGGKTAWQISNNGFVTKIKTNTNVVSDRVTVWADVLRPASTASNMVIGILARGTTSVGATDDNVRVTIVPDTTSGTPTTKVKLLYELVKTNSVIQASTVGKGIAWPVSTWGRVGMILSSARCTLFREPYRGGQRVTYNTVTMSTALNNSAHRRYGLVCRNYTGTRWGNLTVLQTTQPVRLGEVVDYTFGQERAPLEATSNDSSGNAENVTGVLGHELGVRCFSLSSDGAQSRIRTTLLTGKRLTVIVKPSTNTDYYQSTGSVVTGVGVRGATKNAAMFDLRTRGSGVLTYTT